MSWCPWEGQEANCRQALGPAFFYKLFTYTLILSWSCFWSWFFSLEGSYSCWTSIQMWPEWKFEYYFHLLLTKTLLVIHRFLKSNLLWTARYTNTIKPDWLSKGFTQVPDLHCEEAFSPKVQLRSIPSYSNCSCCSFNLIWNKLDLIAAFLYGYL